MTKKTASAWDDDWEAQADKASFEDKETGGAPLNAEPVVLSRAERLAKHKEEQRRLWKSADEPEDFPFLAVSSTIPIGTVGIKPAMKVLSRKPAPQMIKRRDPVTGVEQLTIRDDAAEAAAEAEAEAARNQLTPEQVRQRQQREREEKQRKYDQARAKIFGEPLPNKAVASTGAGTAAGGQATAAATARAPTAASTAPTTAAAATSAPASVASSRQASPISPAGGYGNNGSRGRGRGGRGGSNGGGGGGGSGGGNYRGDSFGRQHDGYGRRSQQAAGHLGGGATSRELYDPNYLPRAGGQHQRRGGGGPNNGGSGSGSDLAWSPSPSRVGTPREDDYIIRAPRGPDGSGRGGFGFARRGG